MDFGLSILIAGTIALALLYSSLIIYYRRLGGIVDRVTEETLQSLKAFGVSIFGLGLMVGSKSGLDPVQELPNGKLAHLEIAGMGRKWQPATAKIDGHSLLVWNEKVSALVAVRYAFSMNPVGCNLYNRQDLPASPFRTDDW